LTLKNTTLSGIGPGDHLTSLGIPVLKNLPGVGGNLQSHIGVGEVIFTVTKPVSFNPLRIVMNPLNFWDYMVSGTGPLSSVAGFDSIGNIRTQYALTNTTWPDISINLISLHINSDGGLIYRRGLNMRDSYFSHFNAIKLTEGFTLLPIIVHPYRYV
jgi:choline dehydrogenase-like flavoprotein